MQASINAHVAIQCFGASSLNSGNPDGAGMPDFQPLEPKEKARRIRGMTYEKLYQRLCLDTVKAADLTISRGCKYAGRIRRQIPIKSSQHWHR